MYLSFKSVTNKEHKGVICNMTYKVPYITVRQIHSCIPYTDKKDFPDNTQKMLVSPSKFRVKIERMSNSSQSTRPVGRVRWEELLVLSRFHSYLRADEWNFCPLPV